jgi:uncharacterized protein (TIGR02611 family)
MKPSSVERQGIGAGRADSPELRGYGVSADEESEAPDGRRPPSVADPTATSRGPVGRLRMTVNLIRANPTGRLVFKIVVAVFGALVVGGGLLLIPLPGPGWLIVIGGLAIWAVEFHWARRLLAFTRRNVQSWTRWASRQSLPVRLLIGAAGLVFVATVLWLSLKYTAGIDLLDYLPGR